jgi:hypothetical protein
VPTSSWASYRGISKTQCLLTPGRRWGFQTSSDDARLFAREFGRSVEDHDFMHLGPYEVILRLVRQPHFVTFTEQRPPPEQRR